MLRLSSRPREARNVNDTAIDWGRYAELYDSDSDEELTLEPGAQEYLSSRRRLLGTTALQTRAGRPR